MTRFNIPMPLFVLRYFFFSYADEYGRPFIILKEQQAKARLKGLEAQKVRFLLPIIAVLSSLLVPIFVCNLSIFTPYFLFWFLKYFY